MNVDENIEKRINHETRITVKNKKRNKGNLQGCKNRTSL